MSIYQHPCVQQLHNIGIAYDDAVKLRRIAMQLRRWYEQECGTDNGSIERDETTGKCYFNFQLYNRSYKKPIPDRETNALKRLGKIMQNYHHLSHYVQTDPRGVSLYILRPQDVPEGADVKEYYSRGIAVYK